MKQFLGRDTIDMLSSRKQPLVRRSSTRPFYIPFNMFKSSLVWCVRLCLFQFMGHSFHFRTLLNVSCHSIFCSNFTLMWFFSVKLTLTMTYTEFKKAKKTFEYCNLYLCKIYQDTFRSCGLKICHLER